MRALLLSDIEIEREEIIMAIPIHVGSPRDRAQDIIVLLRHATAGLPEPAGLQIIQEYGRNPFLILVACLLSLRTKDTTSLPVSRALFQYAQTPQELLALPLAQLETIIFAAGFYRQKAKTLHEVAQVLIEKFGGIVPHTEKELLSIKGIGRKTANLVLGEAFQIPSICVDVHVHRISNRLGLVKTETPEQTEEWLKYVLPQENWIEINRLLVKWGQHVCLPVRPQCSRCALEQICPRFGVKKSR